MSKELVPSHLMVPASTGSLDAYIQGVNKVPILTLEEEQSLARQFRDDDELEAARRMVLAHLRFVVHVAKGYTGYGLALGDLIQEGNIGLMKAVKRFDPDHGYEEVQKVAKDLGVKPEVVLEMESRLSGQDIGFDLPPNADDDMPYVAPAAFLQNHTRDPQLEAESEDLTAFNNNLLYAGLDDLDERSQDIIRSRWLQENKMMLQELGNRYEVSAERIRQLEANALRKMRASITA
jgi:RNA polymerase sigma-32 factor